MKYDKNDNATERVNRSLIPCVRSHGSTKPKCLMWLSNLFPWIRLRLCWPVHGKKMSRFRLIRQTLGMRQDSIHTPRMIIVAHIISLIPSRAQLAHPLASLADNTVSRMCIAHTITIIVVIVEITSIWKYFINMYSNKLFAQTLRPSEECSDERGANVCDI